MSSTHDPELATHVRALIAEARSASTPAACDAAFVSALGGATAPGAGGDPVSAVASASPESRFILAKLWAFSPSRAQRGAGARLFDALVDAGDLGSRAQLWRVLAAIEAADYPRARALASALARAEPTNHDAEGALGLLAEIYAEEGPAGLRRLALFAGAALALGALLLLFARRRAAAAERSRLALLPPPPPPRSAPAAVAPATDLPAVLSSLLALLRPASST